MTGPVEVAAGQVWHARTAPHVHSSRTVLAVDRASVWTDSGRTTVFALRRAYRLAQP